MEILFDYNGLVLYSDGTITLENYYGGDDTVIPEEFVESLYEDLKELFEVNKHD